jgi:hypothetical protein
MTATSKTCVQGRAHRAAFFIALQPVVFDGLQSIT